MRKSGLIVTILVLNIPSPAANAYKCNFQLCFLNKHHIHTIWCFILFYIFAFFFFFYVYSLYDLRSSNSYKIKPNSPPLFCWRISATQGDGWLVTGGVLRYYTATTASNGYQNAVFQLNMLLLPHILFT